MTETRTLSVVLDGWPVKRGYCTSFVVASGAIVRRAWTAWHDNVRGTCTTGLHLTLFVQVEEPVAAPVPVWHARVKSADSGTWQRLDVHLTPFEEEVPANLMRVGGAHGAHIAVPREFVREGP